MRIQAPIGSAKEVKKLIAAGADEFYCGILPDKWKERYTRMGSINRRQAEKTQLKDFDELSMAVRYSHAEEIPVYLTINEHYYTQEQHTEIKEIIEKSIDLGIDGLIVADPALLNWLKDFKIGLCVSTGGVCLNSEAIEFYSGLGARRIILPRHMTLQEIRRIADNKKIELEAFILNEK